MLRHLYNLIVICILYHFARFEIEFKKYQDIFQNQLGIYEAETVIISSEKLRWLQCHGDKGSA